MKLKVLRYLFLICCAYTLVAGSAAFAQNSIGDSRNVCKLFAADNQQVARSEALLYNQRLAIDLPKGINKVRLDCKLDEQSILRFGRRAITGSIAIQGRQDVLEIPSTSPSFLLPATSFTVEFELNLHQDSTQHFDWQPLDQAIQKRTMHNLVMGIFYGICFALIIYVYCMGRILGDKSFRLYSIYVFCATVFFLLQEGQTNLVFPNYSFALGQYWYILFAAFTVCSATVFIVNITDIKKMWPKTSLYFLYPAALCVLLLAIASLFIETPLIANYADIIIARITLVIMLVVFVLVFMQTLKKVKLAWLVLCSLLLMVFAMALRTLPFNISPFVQQYALVIAFAIEAFIFAVVIMSRIQLIKHEKLLALTQANTDDLCEVLNRRGWMQQAQLVIDQQAKKGGVIGTLFIDIDQFKSINDNYGHEAGDKVLRIVASIIRNQTRKGSHLGRLGGDEFVVIGLFDSAQEPAALAHRIKKRLSNAALNINSSVSIDVSVSLGYVIMEQATSITEILSKADHEMYQNKRNKGDLALNY